MFTRTNLIVFFVILTCCNIGASNIHAAWDSSVNNPISTAVGNQISSSIISDGNGGAIIAWNDNQVDSYHNTLSWAINTQRINASGVVQWTADGVAIGTMSKSPGIITPPAITSDGSGGAIITWHDYRNGNWDIYVQRINANGVALWTAGGVPICTESSDQMGPGIVSDDIGGAIIAWHDGRNPGDIYAQRINASGVVQWTANGVEICTGVDMSSFSPISITSDGHDGAIITWTDYSGSYGSYPDIYAQRINNNGEVEWPARGVAICSEISWQNDPR